jgi:hypothetical protein
MKSILCALLFSVAVVSAEEPSYELISRELEWGQGVRLADFGGPDLEVVVRAREMTHVVAEIVDYTRLVPVARANVQGFVVDPVNNRTAVIANPDAKMVPMRTTQRIEKKRGTPFPGSNSEMYLLFREPETGIEVYFLDSIARQNHDNVVIAVPKPAPLADENPLRMAPPGEASPLIPELTAWYDKLVAERRVLDATDPAAVARFNQHAAEYHNALEKVRAAREALKRAPTGSSR